MLSAGQALAQTHDKYGLDKPHKRHYDAQGRMYFRGPLRLTLGAGAAYYSGDLTSKVSENFIRPAVNIGLLYRLSPHFVAGTELSYVELAAHDHIPERNLAFFGRNGVATATMRYTLLADGGAYAHSFSGTPRVLPFVQAGVGLVLFSPHTYNYNGSFQGSSSQALPRERNDYPTLTGVLPLGAGLTVRVTPRLNATLEGNYYFTNTDSLDDVKYRGNPDAKDCFATALLKLEYEL